MNWLAYPRAKAAWASARLMVKILKLLKLKKKPIKLKQKSLQIIDMI